MDSVIRDLDKDLHIEIATGVAQILRDGQEIFEIRQTQSSPSRSVIKMVPYQRNPHFAGRDELLKRLFSKLSSVSPKQYNHRVALYGLGGVGKTQTAIEFIYRHEKSYNDVFWVNSASEEALLSDFQEIAKSAGCLKLDEGGKPTDVAKSVLSWLEQQEGWLLVFDNLDNVATANGYLPKTTSGSHVLITTRASNAISIPAQGLEVDVLEPNEACELFFDRAQLDRTGGKSGQNLKAEAAKIVTELGFLPLAIEQAAAFVREASKDVFAFLPTYKTRNSYLLQRIPDGNWDYSHTVATTWQLEFDIVAQKEPLAVKLLKLFAFLNPDLILIDFLEKGASGLEDDLRHLFQDPLRTQEALCVLERYSLIKRRNDGITIHRLVQAVIAAAMGEVQSDKYQEMVVDMCLATFPDVSRRTERRELCRRFQGQVIAALLKASVVRSKWGEVSRRVGCFLDLEGKWKQAEGFHLKAVDVFSETRGVEHPDTLESRIKLSVTYRKQRKWMDAAEQQEKIVEIATRVHGRRHNLTLRSMQALAETYQGQGRLKDALGIQEKLLVARSGHGGSEKVEDEADEETLQFMASLVVTYRRLGRVEEAAKLGKLTLNLRIDMLGDEHPDTLWSMSNLAVVYRNQRNWEKSLELEERVLNLRLKVLGKEHPDTTWAMANLAVTYRTLGKVKQAIEFAEKSLEVKRKIFENGSSAVLWGKTILARCYRDDGRFGEAVALDEEVLDLRSRIIGAEHPDTLLSMKNLAAGFHGQGRLTEAHELNEKVLALRTRILGDEHPATLFSISDLASVYTSLERYEEATKLYEKVLEVRTRVNGAQHPSTLSTIHDLAALSAKLTTPAPVAKESSNSSKIMEGSPDIRENFQVGVKTAAQRSASLGVKDAGKKEFQDMDDLNEKLPGREEVRNIFDTPRSKFPCGCIVC